MSHIWGILSQKLVIQTFHVIAPMNQLFLISFQSFHENKLYMSFSLLFFSYKLSNKGLYCHSISDNHY